MSIELTETKTKSEAPVMQQLSLFPDLPVPRKTTFECMDCGIHTGSIHEFYMVTDEVWQSAVTNPFDRTGMLCIGCLEQRLKRTLKPDDFPDCRLNTIRGGTRKSKRLLDRRCVAPEDDVPASGADKRLFIQADMLRIIEASGKPLSTFELAAMLYLPAGEPTAAQIKATGRAARGLVKRGKIQKEGHGRRNALYALASREMMTPRAMDSPRRLARCEPMS